MTTCLTSPPQARLKAAIVRVQHDVQRVGLKAIDTWLVHPWRSNISLLITMAGTMAIICAAAGGFLLSLKLVWSVAWPWLMTWFNSESEKQFLFTLGLMASCFCLVSGWKLMTRTIERFLHYTDPHYNEDANESFLAPEVQDPLLYQRCKAFWPRLTSPISRAEWYLVKHFWNQERYLAANAHYLARRLPAIQASQSSGPKKPRM